MTYRSFDEWSSLGYKIKKGSKASWIDDKPVFSEKQVVEYKQPVYREPFYYDYRYTQDSTPEEREDNTVYYADGSGYVPASGPCGPLYFDRNGNT